MTTRRRPRFPLLAVKEEQQHQQDATPSKRRRRRRTKAGDWDDADDEPKRRVVSTACVACRKRKSKCDGNTPACAACSQVYNTSCIYDPNSDHRRKGVYRHDNATLKTRESTLNTIVQAILNYPEDEIPALVQQIRSCESLDKVAEDIAARGSGEATQQETDDDYDADYVDFERPAGPPSFESQLGSKMGELRLDDGSVRYIGGTSHLLFLNTADISSDTARPDISPPQVDQQRQQQHNPITSWTSVTTDSELITHLLNLYFTWHYSYFTCLSRPLFRQSFLLGRQPPSSGSGVEYCSPMLVNAMLALGCHFTARPAARADPADPATAGDHFFREAKRLLLENDEHEKPRITTVQALALMSVREAGCGRESRGWVYSGMSFRMACDMGLHLDSGALAAARNGPPDPAHEDARRITFWGCFLFDKCWSNYLGRLPQLSPNIITCPKYDVFPDEEASDWMPYGDSGVVTAHRQPARTRAVALQISSLCEISSDLMRFFYNPSVQTDPARARGKHAELKKLGEIEIRLERWRRELPKEMEPRDGALSSVFIMHMFYQLLFIHLFRPFLKYTASTSPLPPSKSPRKICTSAATSISRLARLYKRTYGLRQICNICVYVFHTACTIHLLNLPDRDARRDIVHGVKQLEEIAESWPCASRTLGILQTLAVHWRVELPPDAKTVLDRCGKNGALDRRNSGSPALRLDTPPAVNQGEQLQTRLPSATVPSSNFGQQTPQPQLWPSNTYAAYSSPLQTQTLPPQPSMYPQQQHNQSMPQTPYSSIDQSLPSIPILDPTSTQQAPQTYPLTTTTTQTQQPLFPPTPTTAADFFPAAPIPPVSDFDFSILEDQGTQSLADWTLNDQRELAWGLGNWDFPPSVAAAAAAAATPGSDGSGSGQGQVPFAAGGGFEMGF
ncbi:hypothetical protein ANO11243_065820 [Dothideomycetidae sp. 11243]|nr:hypothetical protein ANO11243_065820 [fungal sp. No.11243]